MDADGANLTEVRDQAVALGWTPDGQRIVVSAHSSIRSVLPDGSADEVILKYPPSNGRLVLDWSPDGRWIVMTDPFGGSAVPGARRRGGDQRVPRTVGRRRGLPGRERLGAFLASAGRLTRRGFGSLPLRSSRSVRGMEFRILGPLGGLPPPMVRSMLGGRRQRLVLAHLIVRANDVVPTDVLIDEVWGDEPPGFGPQHAAGVRLAPAAGARRSARGTSPRLPTARP